MDGDCAFTDWMDGIPRPSLSCSVLRAEDIPMRAKRGVSVKISAFFFLLFDEPFSVTSVFF